MAKFDYSGTPEVTPELEAPNDYQHEEASPASFGAALAEGGEAAGAGLMKLADAQTESTILGGSNSLADIASDQQKQFRSLQGQNAIDAYPQFKQDLTDKYNEIAESMPTLAARNAFESNSRRFLQGAMNDAGEHVGQQTLKVQDETAQGQLQATKNFAVANRNQPGLLPQSITDISAQTADYMYRVKGIRDPDAIHAAVQTQVGSLISDTVLASMNEGTTVQEQQQALKNARQIYDQATSSTIPGSPGVPMLAAQDVDKLGQTLNYREWTLSQRADREQEKAAVGIRLSISHQIDNATAMISNGVQVHGGLPTDDQIKAAYPNNPEQAEFVQEKRDDLQNVNYFLGVVPGATPAQIVRLKAQVAPDPNKPDTYAHQLRISAALDHALDVRTKALASDPASYVIATNPDVARAWSAAQSSPQAFAAYAHQVQTTLGTTGMPAQQQSLLPAPVAKSMVQKVESDPESAPGQIQKMEQQYGAYWPQIWRDLVQRGGMSPQYQAVGVIDPGQGALLARALAEPGKSGKDISELLPSKVVGTIGTSVKVNPQIMQLTKSLLTSGGSAAQAATVESSVKTLTFANMAYKGMDEPTALATAVKAFTGQYKFVPDGGARVPVDKYDTVMQNANVMLHGLNAARLALPGNANPAAVKAAILGQESGNNPAAPTSVNGAVGPGQIKPRTFDLFKRPGEVITNPGDNRRVAERAIDHYLGAYQGDVARAAVAYFAGPGNVAPFGSPHPWKVDTHDGNNKFVSSYVSDIQNRLGHGIFNQLGGPKGDDYVRAIQAAPSWITSPNADALWLMDHSGRVVRLASGEPVSVPFNAPPPVSKRAAGFTAGQFQFPGL